MRKALKGELALIKEELETQITQLDEQLADLYEKLDAVELLLNRNREPASKDSNNKGHHLKSKRQPIGKSKSNMSWEEYIKVILTELGGRAKSQEVIDYARKANLRIKEKTLKDSVRSILSSMGTNGKLSVEKAAIKSQGHTFILKEQ